MTYHLQKIPKGVLGNFSKIKEEWDEILDSRKQGISIMELVEFSDMVGAIDHYLKSKYNLGIEDLVGMRNVTERAFLSGRRGVSNLYEYLRYNYDSIHYWGLGFIQVKVGRVNFNVYTDKIESTFDKDSPHNHKYDFESEVLAGTLYETVFQWNECGEGGHFRINNSCSLVNDDGARGVLVKAGELVHLAGASYTRLAQEYHTVSAEEGTVTRVEKLTSDYQKSVNNIIVEGGVLNTEAKGRMDEDVLWEMIKPYTEGVIL